MKRKLTLCRSSLTQQKRNRHLRCQFCSYIRIAFLHHATQHTSHDDTLHDQQTAVHVRIIGPIPWGHSGPLCHALSSLSWTSHAACAIATCIAGVRQQRHLVNGNVTAAHSGEWAQHFSKWFLFKIAKYFEEQFTIVCFNYSGILGMTVEDCFQWTLI